MKDTKKGILHILIVIAAIALMAVVVLLNIVIGNLEIDILIKVVLLNLTDKQALAILLDHAVYIALRGREYQLRLLKFELADNPLIHVRIDIVHRVLTRNTLGYSLCYICCCKRFTPHLRHRVIPEKSLRLTTRHRQQQRGKNQYVSPRGNKWVAQGEGNKRATRVVSTQKEAIKIATKIAKNQGSERKGKR